MARLEKAELRAYFNSNLGGTLHWRATSDNKMSTEPSPLHIPGSWLSSIRETFILSVSPGLAFLLDVPRGWGDNVACLFRPSTR